jgi:hypothetical protein
METNKNKKYDSVRAKTSLIKKANNSDKVSLFANIRNVISAIKAKHLS